ncbi:MAG TPA: terminase family protein, partial [Methanosarcina sp.]|nr:terminase family protein [Methanosarcina sp.]
MAYNKKIGYNGNPYLKQAGEIIEFSMEQAQEYAKCANSIEYFLENYAKIVSLDDGIVNFKPFPYQKRILKALKKNRKVLVKLFRQSGKSTIVAGYVAWYCLFNDNKNACILANKMATAKEIFSRVQMIIELCPKWLQQGVKEWNKTSFALENGSKCFCAATSPSAVRGQSISLLVLDEFAFLSHTLAEEFIASVFPTISSSESSQLIIVSTPKGMNHYYKLWVEAEQGINGFVAIHGKWQEHPKRNQAWYLEQKAILGDVKCAQEVDCSFIGSSNTLIKGEKIAELPMKQPIKKTPDGFTCYEAPHPKKSYVMTVDVAKGEEQDSSAFVIFDISQLPYRVVATFKNDKINTLTYPEVVHHYAKMYNEAFVLVEINSLGQQVADALFFDIEYENMYMSMKTKKDEDIKDGFGGQMRPGFETTKKTKL